MIKAVIFDMDGVIIDAEHLHVQAEQATCKKLGIELAKEDLQIFAGASVKQIVYDLEKRYGINISLSDFNKTREKILYALLEKHSKSVPGVLKFIKFLKNKKVKLGLASGSDLKMVRYVLKRFDLENVFDSLIYADKIVKGKPDPEIFLKSLQELDVKKEDCIIIEDAERGVLAAKNAGVYCVGLINPNSGNQDLSKADKKIKDFKEIYSLFG